MLEPRRDASSDLPWPAFVTHETTDDEAKYIKTLYACALQINGELSSVQAWKDKGLLPSGDEVRPEQSKGQNQRREKAARKKRIGKLRYYCDKYCSELARAPSVSSVPTPTSPPLPELSAVSPTASFVFIDNDDATHSFDACDLPRVGVLRRPPPFNDSPQGVDAISHDLLVTTIEQLSDAEAASMAEVSTDGLEAQLEKQQLKISDSIPISDAIPNSGVGSLYSHASSLGSSMEIERVLEDLARFQDTASQLAASHHASIMTTLGSLPSTACNRRPPEPGSVIIHTTLPTDVASILKGIVQGAEDSATTLALLQEMGVLAVGYVYAERKERFAFLPGVHEEKQADIKPKVRKMMDNFIDVEGEDEKPGCTNLVVYFDTEDEPTPENGEKLNANFALIVLAEARKRGVRLEDTLNQMLDDHERRQARLKLAESTVSDAYMCIAVACSLSGSSALTSADPYTPAGSRFYWQGMSSEVLSYDYPSTSASVREENATALKPSALNFDSDLVGLQEAEPKMDIMAGGPPPTPAVPLIPTPLPHPPVHQLEEERQLPQSCQQAHEAGDCSSYTAPPRRQHLHSPVTASMKPKNTKPLLRTAPPISHLADDSQLVGNAYEELTRPHPPTARIRSELETSTQRARVPSPSAALRLNESLTNIGAEIHGEQPFEIIGSENMTDWLVIDRVIKEYHREHFDHEDWHREQYVGHIENKRLLLNGLPITSDEVTMSNGQKLEFPGSTDGCLYGVIALYIHRSDNEAARKQVADQLIDWLTKAGEMYTFYGSSLREWVRWDRVPPHVDRNWSELMAHLRESFAYLEYTAADQLLYIAIAHVFGPVVIFSERLGRAVRFHAADSSPGGQQEDPKEVEAAQGQLSTRGFVAEAQLPAASEAWIRIGDLGDGHLVLCRAKKLQSEVLLQMLDERDAVLKKQLSAEVPHAALFLGPSKAGKSTVMNALARKTLYDSRPRPPKKGEKKRGMIQPELSVLGDPVKGSEIGVGQSKESMTLLVNSMVVRTDDDETPLLQLLDTPGLFDTRGVLIELVNVNSIAKCIAHFKTLRIVIMISETALKETAHGFRQTAEAMDKLFSDGATTAKKNFLLWVNPKKPADEVEFDADNVLEDVEELRNEANPEIKDFLDVILGQKRLRRVAHVLEYDAMTAKGSTRDAIVRERLKRFPQEDPETPVTKAIFDVDTLLEMLVACQPMKNPADKWSLTFGDKAMREITRQASELHDYVSLRCDLHDYMRVRRYLDVMQSLCAHMQIGTSASMATVAITARMGQGQDKDTSFASMYQAALATVTSRLKSVVGGVQMRKICDPIKQPVPFKENVPDGICFALRAAGTAAVLEPHLSPYLGSAWKELGIEVACEIVCSHVTAASESSCQLLTDHFIKGSSGLSAAYPIFGGQISLSLVKLQNLAQHFNAEADIVDGASKYFSVISTAAKKSLDILYTTLLSAIDTQTGAAADHLAHGIVQANDVASRHLQSLTDADTPTDDDRTRDETCSPFEAAANALAVIKVIEESLDRLVDEVRGQYASSRSNVISVVEQQSHKLCALLEQQKAQWADQGLNQMLASLYFLLHARSSSLHTHCGSDEVLGRLNASYEEPVAQVVEWHAELLKGVLEAAKRGNDYFIKNLSEFQPQVELAHKIAQLADVEKIHTSKQPVMPSKKWNGLQTSFDAFSRRMETALTTFGASVSMRLKDHSNTITKAGLEKVEAYDYKEHTKDLILLKNARWCDAILSAPIIQTVIGDVWLAFEKHAKQLVQGDQGEEGAITLLRKGKYGEARSLLVQLHAMATLLEPSLIATFEEAHRIKDMHDEAESVANSVIRETCEKAQTKALERPGPTGQERPGWWMGVGARDARVTDALWHLNALLDMAAHLVTVSNGYNRLDGWLDLVELDRMQLDASNFANDFLNRLHKRAFDFFAAVGSCSSKAMHEAVRELAGDQISIRLVESASEQSNRDSAAETESVVSDEGLPDITVDMKSAIKIACRELRDVLQLLSRPETYSAVFAAARDEGDPDSSPHDIFHDLSRVCQTSYMNCHASFGGGALPVARQEALCIYSELEHSLPKDKRFEEFRQCYKTHYQHLVTMHQNASAKGLSHLQAKFAKFEFSQHTHRAMSNLRDAAKDDSNDGALVIYEDACSELSAAVRILLETVSLSFTHLKHPDQSFRAQDHLVKPVNQLQSARSHMEFLNEASSVMALDLDAELEQLFHRFQNVFTEDVLQPFAKMFDMGDYQSAEGDAMFGLKRVHILTSQMQAQGGELGKLAREALNAERARQKHELEKIHLVPFQLPFEIPEDESDELLDERLRDIGAFLEKSFKRWEQMSQIKGDCDLLTEYKAAQESILKEVRALLISEFSPLFQDAYLDLSKVHIDYLSKMLMDMDAGGYHGFVARVLSIDACKQNIENHRQMNESQDQDSFASLTAEQQADRIRRAAPTSKSYVVLVQEFHASHKRALQRADTLIRSTNPAYVPPGELEDVFGEIRARAAVAHNLRGIKLDMRAIADLEKLLRSTRAGLEAWLVTNPQSPLIATTDLRGDPAKAAGMDIALLGVVQTYKSLVKLAPVQCPSTPETAPGCLVPMPTEVEGTADISDAGSDVSETESEVSAKHGFSDLLDGARRLFLPKSNCGGNDKVPSRRTSSASSPPSAPPPTNNGARVMALLRSKIHETLAHWEAKPESAQDIARKHQALLRLQRWEPDESVGGGPDDGASIFDAAVELEAALLHECSLTRPDSDLRTHKMMYDERVSRTVAQLQAELAQAKASIDYVDQFQWKSDKPIDPKPFEMITSREMTELINYFGYGGSHLMVTIDTLKVEADSKATQMRQALAGYLKLKQNKHAEALLQTWRYLEPLSSLVAFQHLPGPDVFDSLLDKHAQELAKQAKTAVSMSDKKDGWQKPVAKPMLQIASFGFDIARAASFSNDALAEVLGAAEAKFGAQGMQTLAGELRERDPALGNEIISSSEAFVSVAVADFNQKTQRDISKVKELYNAKNADGSEVVWTKYAEFEREYNQLLEHCNDGHEHVEDPLAYLVEQAKRSASAHKGVISLLNGQAQIPKVLAAIFAWWTMEFLVKLRKRNKHLQVSTSKLRRANNGQVVCILRLLGCTSSLVELKNHLAEVPTGEGKSVIIGVLATALGLYGYEVDCVCYSSMLSGRDCDDFKDMFKAFGLMQPGQEAIRYGTFDTLCEKVLTQQYGDLRQAAREFFATGSSSRQPTGSGKPRVLIIDEVDVLCSEPFFGGAYCPVLTMQNNEIADLMWHIWQSRHVGVELSALKQHPAYRAVLTSGVLAAENEWLLERAVRDMDKAARGYSPGMHDSIVREGKVLYRIEGRDEYGHWTYDYETNAEYFAQYDNGQLDQAQLYAAISLYARCGEFAFAALPKMFTHIFGVTGTLDKEKLPPQMHDVLRREIQIQEFTYCPSMYHSQIRDFKHDNPAYVQVANDVDEHYHLIVNEIDTRLTATTDMEAQRSVIVFFPSVEELHKFRDSSYFSRHREKAKVLTELTASNRDDRDNIIKSATRQGMVTLASRMYGRGTDFKIFDDRMEKAGGMHVLQTFFSRDLSEEVQIMGRCARQGSKGSYSQVLLAPTAAAAFDLTVETVQGWQSSEVYAKLAQLRADAGTQEVRALREMAVKRLKEHSVLAKSLADFQGGANKRQFATLMKRYNSPGGMAVGPNGMHVIFCLDESASMSGWGIGGSPWGELMSAYNAFWQQSVAEPGPPMFVSVVQFGTTARITQQMVPLQGAAPPLSPHWSGTCFKPAVDQAAHLVDVAGPDKGYTAVVVFMSDGAAGDYAPAAQVLEQLAQRHGNQFSTYTVGFGTGAPRTLEYMAFANGVQEKNNYRAASVGNLAEAFSAVAKSIAPGRL